MNYYHDIMQLIGTGVDAFGVMIIVIGAVVATVHFVGGLFKPFEGGFLAQFIDLLLETILHRTEPFQSLAPGQFGLLKLLTKRLGFFERLLHGLVDGRALNQFGPGQRLDLFADLLDAAGVGVAVNLSGGTVTPGKEGGPSEFERNKRLADALYPGRFLQYAYLDYARWNEPDFAAEAVQQALPRERAKRRGALAHEHVGVRAREDRGREARAQPAPQARAAVALDEPGAARRAADEGRVAGTCARPYSGR